MARARGWYLKKAMGGGAFPKHNPGEPTGECSGRLALDMARQQAVWPPRASLRYNCTYTSAHTDEEQSG